MCSTITARGLIGGTAVSTEMTRDSISQRIIHAWRQDEVAMRLGAKQFAEKVA